MIDRVQDTGAASNTVAYGSNNTAGNLLVCVTQSIGAASLTDTQLNAWELADVEGELRIWYLENCPGGANTVTITNDFGPSFCNIWVAEYSGVEIADALDVIFSSTGSGALHTALDSGASSATSQADEVFVGAVALPQTVTFTTPTTEQYDSGDIGAGRGMAVADEILAGTQTCSVTGTAAANVVLEEYVLATFKGSQGGLDSLPLMSGGMMSVGGLMSGGVL